RTLPRAPQGADAGRRSDRLRPVEYPSPPRLTLGTFSLSPRPLESLVMRPTSAVQLAAVCCALLAPALLAQTKAGSVTVPPASRQIAAAVTALPEDLRAGAAVLGYSPQNKLVSLRAGQN